MVQESIRLYLAQTFGLVDIPDDVALFDKGYLDSLQAMELALFVADAFGVEIGQDDMRIENFASIEATAAFVDRKKNPAVGP
ncbi:MAG: acyl carrier protein [Candidatus Sericytochromatia bacterium]|nr:acyl carrier protein [Candidatus Sericytochromatia bacterium]